MRRCGEPLDRRAQRHDAAVILEIAAQRQHVAMTVDDPGLGEWNAATQDSAGSMRLASAASNIVKPSTPLISAWACNASSLGISAASVTISSLPSLRWGMPWDWHKA